MDKPLEQACGNTMSQKVEKTVEEQSEIMIAQHISQMKKHGGGLTLDFAKKQVDYLAVTAHFVNDNWKLVDMVLLFTPFPSCTKKTSENVRLLVVEELEKLGIGSVNLKKLFITTDEGSNLAKLGGSMHQICMSHLGSTIAKRSTKPYKNSCLSEEEKTHVWKSVLVFAVLKN
uniref:Transposase n=1 Tax=Ditylenchus dipsaci TaxID=166011 RepID=A0A915D4J2_9BILA